MKKPKKILKIVLSVIVVLILVVILAINFFADSALKIGVETAATKALNVDVTLDKVNLGILSGSLVLNGLDISNPPGYEHDKLLELSTVDVAVDISSLLTDTVNIDHVKLDGINMVLEQKGVTSNNVQDIIKSLPEKEEPAEKPEKAPEPKEEKPSKKLHIDTLEITNVSVKVKMLPIPGKSDTVTLKLAPIKMEDIGGDEDVDTAELSRKILTAIVAGVAEQGKGIISDDIIGPLNDQLGKLGEISGELLKEGAEMGKELLEGTKDIGKGLEEGLKGIFGPKKED